MIENYTELFSAGVRELPKFMGVATAVLKQVADLREVVLALGTAFSLESVAGVQLDLIGGMIGIARVDGQTDEDYRKKLKGGLAVWRWSGTNETVREVLEEAYPGESIRMVDNGDMTVTVSGWREGALPIPAGVRLIRQ